MINVGRIARFSGNLSKYLVPLGAAVLVLAVLAAIISQGTLTPSWELLTSLLIDLIVFGFVFGSVILAVAIIAGRFVSAVYDLDSTRQGIGFLVRQLFGKLGFGPFMIIGQGKVIFAGDGTLKKIGGPGALVIHNDTAVVIEQKGKVTRILGPGLPLLESFEKVYDIIDLRPKRWIYEVNAITREGVPVAWNVEVCYQIDNGGRQPTDKNPYPFSEDAIIKTITNKWRREKGRIQDMDWEGRVVISATEGTLRSMIARRYLDELIGLTETEIAAARETMQQELLEALEQAVPNFGAKIISVKLHNLKVKDEVTELWIEAWQTRWQSWSTRQLAPKEAERIQEFEKAKAEAHILALNALTEELEKLENADQSIVMMRLATVLDQGTMGVSSRVFFPGQAVETLAHIRQILRSSKEDDNRNGTVDADANHVELLSNGSGPVAIPREVMYVLPVFDEVSAGHARPVLDEVQGYMQQFGDFDFEFEDQILAARSLRGQKRLHFFKEKNYMAVKVAGNSMDRAEIDPGDFVILEHRSGGGLAPDTGDIVVVVFRDEDTTATLKRITIQPDGVTFKPESSDPLHQPRTVSRDAFTGDPPQVEITAIALAVLKLVI